MNTDLGKDYSRVIKTAVLKCLEKQIMILLNLSSSLHSSHIENLLKAEFGALSYGDYCEFIKSLYIIVD